MSFEGINIRSFRERKGWSQQDLANAAKISQTTIDKIERGQTKKSKYIPEIAQALEVDLADLQRDPVEKKLENISSDRASWMEAYGLRPRLPVFPTFEARAGVISLGRDPISELGRPSFLDQIAGAYCVYISGNTMAPEYEPGDIAFINPALPPIRNTTCIFLEARQALCYIRRLIDFDDDLWQVRQWDPPSSEPLLRETWSTCHRLVGKYARR